MPLPSVIVDGKLAADPELTFVQSGIARCEMRIVCEKKIKDDAADKWITSEVCYLRAVVWREMGEHCAESLRRGDEVLLWGDLRSVEVAGADGTSTWQPELYVARAVGPSLRFRTTPHSRDVAKAQPQTARDPGADPWATPDQ
jgi:single-strand DNA-binding protein